MDVQFQKFDISAVKILTSLMENFPASTKIGYADLYPDEQDNSEKREAHIGVIAFLRHENLIAHEMGSASSFILTSNGLTLFGREVKNHLASLLQQYEVD